MNLLRFSFFRNTVSNVYTRRASRDELYKFVAVSSGHPHIHGDAARRAKLYDKWFAGCPAAFYLLEHFPQQGCPPVLIGVSIILPLTRQGEKRIREADADAFSLRDTDIDQSQNYRYGCILMDTLAIDSAYPRKDRPGYTHKLVADHLRHLLGESTRLPLDIFVEPDTPSVIKHLKKLHFKTIDKSEEENAEPLYHRKVPDGFRTDDYDTMYQQLLMNEP